MGKDTTVSPVGSVISALEYSVTPRGSSTRPGDSGTPDCALWGVYPLGIEILLVKNAPLYF